MHRYSSWCDVSAVIRHLARLSSFSKSERTHPCRRALQPGNCSSTEIGLTTRQDGCAKLRFVWHTSLTAAAIPGLMGLGGDARVQSIPRAANHIYGAECTR